MRQFFQWINSKKKITGQESPQQKAKFTSTFAPLRDPAQSAALVSCGPPEAHELMAAIGKILEEKPAWRYEPEAAELSQQKGELQAQVEPDEGHPSNHGALSDPQPGEWARTTSCSQDAVPPDKSFRTRVRQKRDRIRQPWKVVAFKDQHLCQSQPPSPP